jgi:hypothetical protein
VRNKRIGRMQDRTIRIKIVVCKIDISVINVEEMRTNRRFVEHAMGLRRLKMEMLWSVL